MFGIGVAFKIKIFLRPLQIKLFEAISRNLAKFDYWMDEPDIGRILYIVILFLENSFEGSCLFTIYCSITKDFGILRWKPDKSKIFKNVTFVYYCIFANCTWTWTKNAFDTRTTVYVIYNYLENTFDDRWFRNNDHRYLQNWTNVVNSNSQGNKCFRSIRNLANNKNNMMQTIAMKHY